MTGKLKPIMKRKLAYFEDRGSDLKNFALLRSVYFDDIEKAKAVLKADPAQLNRKDPYAGLTALHIAIFRQSPDMVKLLLGQPNIDLTIQDGFGRAPIDMLDYTTNQQIFSMMMEAVYPDEMRALEDEAFDEARADQTVASFKPKGP